MPNLYALEVRSLDGRPAPMSEYRGRAALVVNVASECGLTPQYAGLQALHRELAPRGFTVLAFPSNEFGGQEPGTAATIEAFCTSEYGVTFPMFEKCATQPGAGQSPVYRYLTTVTGQKPSWNFAKYVVDPEGRVTHFFGSRVAPDDPALRAAIEAVLPDRAPRSD